MLRLAQLLKSAGFYPITMLYLAGVAIICLIAGNVVSVVAGILLLAFAAILALMFAAWRELRTLHTLINGQRTELLARIDELAALLVQAGLTVPAAGDKEAQARSDARREGKQ